MKIAFYSDTVFSFGGVQRVLAEVAKELARRHEVTILSLDFDTDMQMYGYAQSNVQFYYLNYPSQPRLSRLWRRAYGGLYKYALPHNSLTHAGYAYTFFPQICKEILLRGILDGHFDVVIGVHCFLSMHLASIRQRIPGRVIGWMHNSFEAFFLKEQPYLPRLKDFFVYCMRQLDGCVVLCQADAERYQAELGLQPTVIYNPLTLVPTPDPSPVGTVHHRILSVGRFSPRHKGFDILLKAFARFSATHPEWRLQIVGDGPEKPLYEQIIKDYGIQGKVELLPFTSRIGERYVAADFYVLSSRWEGLPLVLMEAMAHGLPVVASSLPVTRELFRNQSMALLFPSEDVEALAKALAQMTDGNRWLSLKEAARQYAARFTVESIGQEWERIIGG